MGVSSSLTPDNPLASMIAEHEDASSMSEARIYQARAAELRQEAKQTHWADVRDRVLALAEEYHLLAESLDRLTALAEQAQKIKGSAPMPSASPVKAGA